MSIRHLLLASAVSTLLLTTALPAISAPTKNIVLVHGAWVNGSGNRRVDRPNGVSQRPRFMAALNNPRQDRSIRIQRS